MKHFEFVHDQRPGPAARSEGSTGMVLRGLDLADEHACTALRTALSAALEHRVPFVVIDASHVTDLDQQTVTSIRMAGGRLRSLGGALVLTHASARVQTLLRTFGAGDLLQVLPTDVVRLEARAALTAAPSPAGRPTEVAREVPVPRQKDWATSSPPSTSVA